MGVNSELGLLHYILTLTLFLLLPPAVLGLSPAWYKEKAYRARIVREPRAVLAEFGTILPEKVAIRVHDSTAELRWEIVTPLHPKCWVYQ